VSDQVPPQWEQQQPPEPQAQTQPLAQPQPPAQTPPAQTQPVQPVQPPQQQPMPQYGAAPQWGQPPQQPQQQQPQQPQFPQAQAPHAQFPQAQTPQQQYPQQPPQQQFPQPPQWAQQQQPQQSPWGQPPPPQQPQDAQAWGGQQWQIPQQPGYGWPQPAAPTPRWFRRKQTLAIGAVVLLAMIGGGIFAFTQFKSDTGVSVVDCKPSALTSCLIAKPSSSSADTDSWGASTTPSKDDYLAWAFPSDPVAQQTASDNLSSEGLQHIAHTAWKSSDGNGIDITLLKFSAPQGAHARGLELLSGDLVNGPAVSVPIGVPGTGFATTDTNSDGDIVTLYSAYVGDIALQVRYTSPQKYSADDFGSWLSAEYSSLSNAPKPAASPEPTSSTQSVACSGSLSDCLLPAPSGSTPWTDTWGTNTSPTAQEYAAEMFSSSTWQTIIGARLNTAGLTGVTHRAWITSNGAEADDVLLSFSSANGAMAWYKSDAYSATGTSFTIPNQKDSTGTYNPKADTNGDIAAQVFGVSGTVAMELFTWSPTTFDQSRTVTWASQQLTKVTATATTKTVTVAAVPTPTAAAPASSGSCASAQTCLIDAPTGSVPWTGADYDKTTTATVQQYVEENYDTADQSYEENLLDNAGVTGIAHREWDATDGTSAILTVLQYGTAKEAQSESLAYQGATLASGTEMDVSGLTNAVVDIKAMDTDGNIPVKVDLWKGSYELRLSFYNPATATPQTAVAIALQQLAKLPAS